MKITVADTTNIKRH